MVGKISIRNNGRKAKMQAGKVALSLLVPILTGLIFAGIFCTSVYVFAAPLYSAGQGILNPACAPGSENCTITSFSYSFGANNISGTGDFLTTAGTIQSASLTDGSLTVNSGNISTVGTIIVGGHSNVAQLIVKGASSDPFLNLIGIAVSTGDDSNPISVAVSPDGKYVYEANQTNALINSYGSTSGALSSINYAETASSPNDIAVSPDGNYVYVANYSGSVGSYSATSGTLDYIGASNTGSQSYAVAVSPDGKYIYVVNRGDDTVESFSVTNGVISTNPLETPVSTGSAPWSVVASGNYIYVVNNTAGTLQSFEITSGVIVPTPISTVSTGTNPISVAVLGDYVYVANNGDNSVQAFNVVDGVINYDTRNTVSTGISPTSMSISLDGKYLYVVSINSFLKAFSISDGNLTLVNYSNIGQDGNSEAISIAAAEDYVYIVDYYDNYLESFSFLPGNQENNLQEWQDSNKSILASVDGSGHIFAEGLKIKDSSGNYYTTISGGDSAYTLPAADGSAGDFLIVDGGESQGLSWGAGAGSFLPYSNATADVDLGSQNIATTGTATFGTITPNAKGVSSYGLVCYWTGDGNANDLSGQGNNGTWTGTEAYATGKFGNAFSFNGSNFVHSDTPATTNVDNWTISAWVNPNGSNGYIVMNGANASTSPSDDGGYGFYLNNNKLGAMYASVKFFDSGYTFPSTGVWYYVVMERANGTTKFYVNGEQVGNTFSGAQYTPIAPTQLNIATGNNNGEGSFSGLIDEVMLYSRALSADEIKSLYGMNTELVAKENIAGPKGINGAVQYNSNGSMAGSSQFTWDNTTGTLNVASTNASYVQQFEAGGIETVTLVTAENATIGNDLDVKGEMSIGQNLLISGNASISGNLTVAGTITPHAQGISTQGLVGYWSGDGNANDFSTSGNNGTFSAGTYVAGKFGKAFSFDGSGAVLASDSGLPVGNSDRTISFWLKTASTNSDITMFSYGSDGEDKFFSIVLDGNGMPYIFGLGSPLISYTSVNNNLWHLITVTHTSTSTKIYIDAILDVDYVATFNTVSSGDLSIGGDQLYNSNFVGLLDQVMIYNRALSADEVKSMYESNSEFTPKEKTVLATVGGTDAQVQFNSKGALGGSSGMVWDNVHGTLTVDGSTPTVTATIPTGANPSSVYVQGNYAYVANNGSGDGTDGLAIIDISDPASPGAPVFATTSANPSSVFVQGRYAYTPGSPIIDVSDPTNPTPAGDVSLPIGGYVYVQGRYAYVVSFSDSNLFIIDISNPATPTTVSTPATGAGPYSVYVQGRYAYVTNRGDSTLSIIDLGGAYIQQFEAGGIETGTLAVRENAQIGNDLDVKGGMTVSGPVLINGSGDTFAVSGNATILGSLTIGGATKGTLVTRVSNGSPWESDADGALVIDSSDNSLYINYWGGWHQIAQTAGFQIPKNELIDPLSGKPIQNNDLVVGMINKKYSDNGLHGVWVKWSLIEDQLIKELQEMNLSSTGTTGSGLVEGVDQTSLSEQVKNSLSGAGIALQNGVAYLKQLTADTFVAKTTKIQRLEIIDRATGDIYCTWIENGLRQKTKGECKDVAPITTTIATQPAVSPENPVSEMPTQVVPEQTQPEALQVDANQIKKEVTQELKNELTQTITNEVQTQVEQKASDAVQAQQESQQNENNQPQSENVSPQTPATDSNETQPQALKTDSLQPIENAGADLMKGVMNLFNGIFSKTTSAINNSTSVISDSVNQVSSKSSSSLLNGAKQLKGGLGASSTTIDSFADNLTAGLIGPLHNLLKLMHK